MMKMIKKKNRSAEWLHTKYVVFLDLREQVCSQVYKTHLNLTTLRQPIVSQALSSENSFLHMCCIMLCCGLSVKGRLGQLWQSDHTTDLTVWVWSWERVQSFTSSQHFHLRKLVHFLLTVNGNVCIVPGERGRGDGYQGQGESAEGPRLHGHHLQSPGPSVCEEWQTCVNVSKKWKKKHSIDYWN